MVEASLSAGGAATLVGGGDVTLAGNTLVNDAFSHWNGGTLSLLSTTTSKSSAVWQSSGQHGHSDTTVKMTELTSGGTVSLIAGKGIVADYKATGDLQTSLAALAQDPKTAWVAQLATRDAVREAHQKWDHDAQGLSAAASAIIAIVVAAVTAGAGLGAMLAEAAGMAGSATAAAAFGAGFSTLASQASVSLINNQGDLGKTLQEMGSLDTVKNLAISMASAGAMSEVGNLTDGHFGGTAGTNEAGQTPSQYFGTSNYAANVAGHAAVGCAMGAASGGSCASGAASAGLATTATPLTMGAGFAGGTALAAGIGGTASVLTGGTFAQGAKNGAYGYLYNEAQEQAMAWGQGGVGLSSQQQISQFAQDLNARVSFYVGVSDEATIGSGAAVQGGTFITPGQLNLGFYGTVAPTQSGANIGTSIVVGAQLDGMKGLGWSAAFSSPSGGGAVNTDVFGNPIGLSWSPPSPKFGSSVGPTWTCQVSIHDSGC